MLNCVQPGSVPIDTVTMIKALNIATGDLLLKTTSTHQIIYEVIVMRSPTGQTDLVVDVNTIRFTGTNTGINGLTTDQIFGYIGSNTVQQGLNMGFIKCGGILGSSTVRVLQVGCAERVGSGIITRFVPCTTECCIKRYTIQCLLGIPLISLMSSEGPVCGPPNGPCRSTCGNAGSIGVLPSLTL